MWLSETFTRPQAWVDLIMLANHTDGEIRRRGIKINVKRGQVGVSQESLAARWKWSKNKVRRFLKELEKDDQISQKTELKNVAVSSLITIENYETYQGNGTEDETENGPKTKPKTAPEQECKEVKDSIPYSEIIQELNSKTGKNYRATSSKTKTCIRARWSEGFRFEDFSSVIRKKTRKWKDDPKMADYLRPETLFGTKFESYLNEPEIADPTKHKNWGQ